MLKYRKCISEKVIWTSKVQSNNPLLKNKGPAKDGDIPLIFLHSPVFNGLSFKRDCSFKRRLAIQTKDILRDQQKTLKQSMKANL